MKMKIKYILLHIFNILLVIKSDNLTVQLKE